MEKHRGVPTPNDDPGEDAPAGPDFGAALEAFESAHPAPAAAGDRRETGEPRVGGRVSGRVVSIGSDTVLVDIGGRSEGVADARVLRAEDGTLAVEVGQELEWFVVGTGEQVQLSRTPRAPAGRSLAAVRQAREAGLPVRGRVTSVNKGGLTVDVDGVRAFCPLSQIEEGFVADAAPYVGRALEFRVTEVDEARTRVVLSRRQFLKQQHEAEARERVAALSTGQDVEGRVTRLEPFGAFVDLGGVEGMVHVSEISHTRLAHARDALALGETVHARVLRVDKGRDGRPRVALSIRAGAPDPWADVAQRFAVGTRVPGVVVRLADFGAFVNLAPGIDGLVHVSQVSESRIGHVREVLSPGQAVDVVVLAVEQERKRISLSMREPREGAALSEERPAEPERRGGREAPGGRESHGERGPRGERDPKGGRGSRGGGERRGGREERGGRGEREPREPREARPQRPAPPEVVSRSTGPEPLTPMQLAFKRAREAQKKREERG